MIICDNSGQQKFAQCELSNGDKHTVGFIPAWAAKIGNRVELTELDGQFWKVEKVGVLLTREQVRTGERRFKQFQGSLVGGGIDE